MGITHLKPAKKYPNCPICDKQLCECDFDNMNNGELISEECNCRLCKEQDKKENKKKKQK